MDYEKPNDITDILQNLITLYFNKDYKTINKILNIEHNPSKDESVYKYNNKGMTFLENDNPSTYVRLYVDEETKLILDTLSMVTYKTINEKTLNDLIIEKWIEKVHITGTLNREDILENVGKETQLKLEVGKETWNNLYKACKNKCIYMKEGFKMSVISYFDKVNTIELEY